MEARLRYTPSMRQRLDPERIYRDARSMVPATMDGLAPIGEIPARCPFTLDELLSEAVLDLSA
jgi:uncharacterized protein DUF29